MSTTLKTSQLLLGQKLLDLKLKPVNLYEALGCAEIQRLEDEASYQDWDNSLVMLIKQPLSKFLIIKRTPLYAFSCVYYHLQWRSWLDRWKSRCLLESSDGSVNVWVKKMKVCSVKIDHVTKYAAGRMPPESIQAMNRLIELGYSSADFYVAYPVVGEVSKTDPVLVLLFNTVYYLVHQWE